MEPLKNKLEVLKDLVLDRYLSRNHWACGVMWHMRQAKRYLAFDVMAALKPGESYLLERCDELTQARAIGKRSLNSIPLKSSRAGLPRILFFSMRGFSLHLTWENVLATALRLRGAECLIYTCSGGLPLCGRACMEFATPTPCQTCAPYSKAMFENLGHEVHRLDEFAGTEHISRARRIASSLKPDQLEGFSYKGLPLGELVQVSVLHVLHSGQLYFDAAEIAVYKDFLASGMVMTDVCTQLLERYKPDVICMLNGLLFAERILYELARQRGKTIITHEVGTMVNTLMFSKHLGEWIDSDAGWERYSRVPLNRAENERLDTLLESRKQSERELIKLWSNADEGKESIYNRLNLDREKMVVTLFSNLLWDTGLIGKDRAFTSMTDWVLETIKFFQDKPGVQLVVRVHPSEVKCDGHIPKEKLAEIITACFPRLPQNIRVVAPDSDISSYTLMSISSCGIAYVTTAGLEMAVMGKPVISPADVHYGRKGFTYDAETKEDYFRLLRDVSLLPSLNERQMELARRYAYLFFFQLMLPFRFVHHEPRKAPRFTFTDVSELAPGKDEILDHICDAILTGGVFALPRELVASGAADYRAENLTYPQAEGLPTNY